MSIQFREMKSYARSSVNAFRIFPEVDELLDAVAAVRRDAVAPIGVSRQGEPMLRLCIGRGDRHAVIVAGGHANEPIGFHTVIALARLLSDRSELTDGWTWHLVACLDPVSARLNRWYGGPLGVDAYHRWLYRPHQQPGWGLTDAPALPEAAALKELVDETRPRLVLDLHSCDFGGAYFVVNPGRCAKPLADELVGAVGHFDLPLQTAPSEAHGWDSVRPGVVVMPQLPEFGVSLHHYAARYGALVVAPEVPLWGVDVRTPADIRHQLRHDLRQVADRSVAVLDEYLAKIPAELGPDTPFKAAAELYLPGLREIERRARDWAGEPTAEEYAAIGTDVYKLRLRALGMIRRHLTALDAVGNVSPGIRALTSTVERLFGQWIDELNELLSPRPHPLANTVAVQIATALAAKRHTENSDDR
jgi:hypothetical protein